MGGHSHVKTAPQSRNGDQRGVLMPGSNRTVPFSAANRRHRRMSFLRSA